MTNGIIDQVRALYEERPYPAISMLSAVLGRVPTEQLPLLNYETLHGHAYGASVEPASTPKILVAGAGTFEPLAVAVANPSAEIYAVDLSARSLAKLARQAKIRRIKIHTYQGDLLALPRAWRDFDFVIATGVLHHLPNPSSGVRALQLAAKPNALFRFLVYSKYGRELLYRTKDFIALLKIKKPKEVRALIEALPYEHPYRNYFHLYSDTQNDTGLADGYLHPCDQAFSALEWQKILAERGLRAGSFLHKAEGQPNNSLLDKYATQLNDWQKIEALDLLGELQENYTFTAANRQLGFSKPQSLRWSPVFEKKGQYFSKILGKSLAVDPQKNPLQLSQEEVGDLYRALFLY